MSAFSAWRQLLEAKVIRGKPLLVFGIAIVADIAAAYGWALLRVPYEQRDALRVMVREYTNKANRLKDRRFEKHLEDQQNFAKSAMNYIYPETRAGRTERLDADSVCAL